MADTKALAERLTAVALDVPGVVEVYPSSAVSGTLGNVVAGITGAADQSRSVTVSANADAAEVQVRIGVSSESDTPGVARAVSDALESAAIAELGGDVVVAVRVQVSSIG